MSEIRRNEIIYEEGWRETAPVIEEEEPVDEAPVQEENAEDRKRGSKPLLITIQLALSLLAALILFLLKTMDSEAYYHFMEYYRDELQKPVVSQEVFSSADVSRLFSQNPFFVQASPDETADRKN